MERFRREWELYQEVTPGEPEGNGLSCLIGEANVAAEVEEDGAVMEGVGRSKVRVRSGVRARSKVRVLERAY